MKSLINQFKESCDDSGIDLAKLAVIAAFFTLFGDFLAFIGAILALQEGNSKDTNKKQLQRQIEDMYRELDKISKSL